MLLPGMDGTGDLFASFVSSLPTHIQPIVVDYPVDRFESYEALESLVRDRLQSIARPFALLAESFSGPIGIRIAASHPPNLVALILVATFARSPLHPIARHLVRPLSFNRPLPAPAIRALLAGRRADDASVHSIAATVSRVAPSVIAGRVREVLTVDVTSELAAVELPLLFLAGRRDRLVRTRRADLEGLNPRIRWADIDSPHMVLQIAPNEAAKVIDEFLAKTKTGPHPARQSTPEGS